ncbi:MAG TPA: sigma-70 family RNA polymerase sigma factor [Candidatus Saccharimonadales bacterium]|jgi:RNA polymerase sigma-70 factor (ECF subfamily)|nr:sigma-70 family RNA polymerase sigma factor [Candidatus Saccharimonadales bacterium]
MQATMQMTQVNMAGAIAGAVPLALEQVFAEHREMVFRSAYRITGNASDAEDVLQVVFLRLLRQERAPEIAYLRAYLHRAAINAALDLLRRRKDAHSVSLEEEAGVVEAMAAGGQESSDLRDWLRQALARINPRWAEMFVLRFVEGYSNSEIARMMDTSAAVVAVLLHRTRAQLKKDYMAVTRGRR